MKNAMILHGTNSNPAANWYPWLQQKLQQEGYDVWTPQLPDCHQPNRRTYNDFLFSSGWDLADNIVVGHSSGAVAVMNMLMDNRCPRIRLGVMVGAWKDNDWSLPEDQLRVYAEAGLSEDQFSQLFPPAGFNFDAIRSKANGLAFVHGADDPQCPLDDARLLAGQLGAQLIVAPRGGHFSGGYFELPEVWHAIAPEL